MTLHLKKTGLVAGLVLLLVVVLACALPLQSDVHEQVRFHSNISALNRQLLPNSVWQKWWPGKVELSGKEMVLSFEGFRFYRKKNLLNTVELQVLTDSFSTPASLTVVQDSADRVVLTLQSTIELDHNPIQRIKMLWVSSSLKKAFQTILRSQSTYFSSIQNLYGIAIEETTVQFQYYATFTQNFRHTPTAVEQYAMIDRVKKYVRENKANEKGYPMLNVTRLSAQEYYVQVAIPTNVQLPEEDGVKSKWMPKGGHILVAKVKGGPTSIAQAKQQVQNYIFDHHKVTVAIPFETLMTNRLEQTDPNQWITEIYFPVL